MCILCGCVEEMAIHIFAKCIFARMVWSFFCDIVDFPFTFSSIEDIWIQNKQRIQGKDQQKARYCLISTMISSTWID